MIMSWKNPRNSLKIHMKLELSIFLEDLYPQKHFFYQKLLSWKILILALKSPGKVLEKWIQKSVGTLKNDVPEKNE